MKKDTQCQCSSLEPFPKEIIDIYQQLIATDNPEARGPLLIDLARTYMMYHDVLGTTDSSLPDKLHDIADEYNKRYLAYNQATTKLGRAVMRVIEANDMVDLDEDTGLPDISPPAPNRSSN